MPSVILSLWYVAVAYFIIGNVVLYTQLRQRNVPLELLQLLIPGYLSARCRASRAIIGVKLLAFVWTVDAATAAMIIFGVTLSNGVKHS